MEIHNSTALVTGANRGIGRAIAEELASRGAQVLAGVRDLDPAHEVPARTRPVKMDLSSPGSVSACVDELGGETVDLLVNNAGEWIGGVLETQDPDRIAYLVQTNLISPMLLTRLLLPGMLQRGRGKIVNNASIVGHAPFPGATTYAASKAGLHGFTESLRRELAETDIGVLELITPGIDTDMMGEVQRDLEGHTNTDGWDHVEPSEWATKVADAIESDDDELNPGGAERLAKLLPKALLDVGTKRGFSR